MIYFPHCRISSTIFPLVLTGIFFPWFDRNLFPQYAAMALNCTAANPPYFETVWAGTSTYALANVIAGLMIAGIIGRLSGVVLVPIVTSAGCAIANGVGYYVFRLNPPPPVLNKAIAYPFAEIVWMVSKTFGSVRFA